MKRSLRVLLLLLAILTPSAHSQQELFSLEGPSVADEFGVLVRSAGDVDADGVPDFLVASREGLGRVFVYSGATRQVLHDLEGAWGFFGRSMDALGDVDGDGFGDFAVSETPGGTSPPSFVHVFSGGTGTILYTRSAVDADVDRLGTTIEGVEDLDGDGRGDLLVFATDGCCPTESEVICYSGATGAEVFRLFAPSSGNQAYGAALAGLGDLDGDGVGEFAVSDREYLVTSPSIVRGRAIVYSGATRSELFSVLGGPTTFGFSKRLADAGDVDGDGVRDLLVASQDIATTGFVQVVSGATGAEVRRLEPSVPLEEFGDDIAGAGDVDGDGRDDVLVGSPGDVPFLVNAGTAYVYSGATGQELFHVEGEALSEKVGTSVAPAGDLDGDGRADVLVGRPRFVTTAQDPGSVTCHTFDKELQRLEFELDEDGITALENGRSVDANARFGTLVRIGSLGVGHYGAAVFDSSPVGPNAGSADPNLLVDRGNLLILQGDPQSTEPGIFDHPDDAPGGGTLRIEFRSPATLVSVDLVDVGPGDDDARVRLIDEAGFTRTYTVPAGFSTDGLSAPQDAVRTLRLDTLVPQRGVSATATGSEDADFDADLVIVMEVHLESTGAIDDVRYFASGIPPAAELTTLYPVPSPDGPGFGSDVRSMSDLDGDGAPELLVSQQNGGSGLGVGRLYSGATGALLQEFPGQQPGSLFGDVITGVGDVDGDGTEDIGVGGWRYELDGADDNGVVRIYSGQTYALVHELFGEEGARLGTSVEALQDLDGDGHDEFLVGSNAALDGRGRIEVRSGATGEPIYELLGEQLGEGQGSWVRNMGDVDLDGVDDFFSASGNIQVFRVFSGSDGALLHEIEGPGYGSKPAGDVNLDGHADVLLKDWTSSSLYVQVLSGRDWSVLHDVGGPVTSVSQYRTAPAGDQDGDGHADFFVAAPYDPIGPNPSGHRIQVLSGRTGLMLFEQEIEGAVSAFEFAGDLDGDGFGELFQKAASGVETVTVRRRHGFAVCSGEVNSTGLGARLLAQGSFDVFTGTPTIRALDLPPGAMTLLLTSATFGHYFPPIVTGTSIVGGLCIAGGPILRLDVGIADSNGDVAFPLDLTSLAPPGRPVSSLVGRSLFFQGYYRDPGTPQGGLFTEAIVARFE